MKKLLISGVKLIYEQENFTGIYRGYGITTSAHTYVSLDIDELMPIAKAIAEVQVNITTQSLRSRIEIDKPDSVIVIYDELEISDYNNPYQLYVYAPSLTWFADYRKDIENPDPKQIYFVDNRFAVRFNSYSANKDFTIARVIDVLEIDDYVENMVEDEYEIPWLEEDSTLNEYVEKLGYSYNDKAREVERAITLYYMAMLHNFHDPKEVVAYFYGKKLAVELSLNNAFNGIVD